MIYNRPSPLTRRSTTSEPATNASKQHKVFVFNLRPLFLFAPPYGFPEILLYT